RLNSMFPMNLRSVLRASSGTVQQWSFLGNTPDPERVRPSGGSPWLRAPCGSSPLEALVAEPLQPVRVRPAREEFRRTLAHPLGVPAAPEAGVVEKELQERQVARSQLPPEEEVGAQPAVEVLGHAAGPPPAPGRLRHRHTQPVV